MRLHHDGVAIYMVEFSRAKTEYFSRGEMDLLMREVKAYTITIFYIVILILLIFGICVCSCVCNKQSVHALYL